MLATLAWLAIAQPSPIHDAGSRLLMPSADQPPNILLIVSDDMGTDLLEAYEPYYPGTPTNPPAPPTPAIDWLVDGGMLFTDCWTSPVCSPTRAQILTGMHNQRTGVGRVIRLAETGLDSRVPTLPQFLRKQTPSYATAAVGKWHLASAGDRGAHALGPESDPWFDVWAGSMSNFGDYNQWEKTFATPIDPALDECRGFARFPCRVMVDAESSISPSPGEYATVDTVDDAVHLVGTLQEPWFLYVSFNAAHKPLSEPALPLDSNHCLGFDTIPDCVTGGVERDTRCLVQWMDNEIGRLFCDLEYEGLTDRTMVIFMGDNGTAGATGTGQGGSAITAPFEPTHDKGTLYQGGVNVPLIVRGPGVVQGTSHQLVCSTDLLATIAQMAGLPHPDRLAPDSISFVPYLSGQDEPLRKTVFVEKFVPNFIPVAGGPPEDYRPSQHLRSIRNAEFKLIRRETQVPLNPVRVEEEFYDLRRTVERGPQADPYELEDLRPQITPGGPSPLDRAYGVLLREMQSKYPSLFDRRP